jgi:hypothetical protein
MSQQSMIERIERHFAPHPSEGILERFTYPPRFANGREDVCAVKHQVGLFRETDIVYLFWGDDKGLQNIQILHSDSFSGDHLEIDTLSGEGDEVTIAYSSGGGISDKGPWSEMKVFNLVNKEWLL